MNLDQIDRMLSDALPFLAGVVFPLLLILAGVFIAEWLRLGRPEDDYSVDDYAAPVRVPLYDDADRPSRRQLRPATMLRRVDFDTAGEPDAPDILPPAPVGANAGAPLYAALTARQWLREVGEDARAKAGIRPSYATADRDMTGAFPVVRAA